MHRSVQWAIVALLALSLLAGATPAEVAAPPAQQGSLAAQVLGVSAISQPDHPSDPVSPVAIVPETSSPGEIPTLESLEDRLLHLLNAERVDRGLPPLLTDPRLLTLARQRSDDLSTRGYFSHVTPEGTTIFNTMDRLRIPYRLAGENLGRTNYPLPDSPRVVHRALIESPAHAVNEFDPEFNRVGIGAALSSDGFVYYTELFAVLD